MKKIFNGVIYALLIVLFFAGFATPNTALTQDLGRHILLGNIILKNLSVPTTNLFSYTYPDFPFINHHYLSEVIFSSLSFIFGTESLLYVTVSSMLIACFLLFLYAKKQSDVFSLALVSILNLRILFERVDVRPEIFSFLLSALFVTLLYRNREKPSRFIFVLIPLTFLWTQLHIYFFVGIVVIGLFFLDSIIRKSSHRDTKYIKLLGITLIGSLAMTFLNPNGLSQSLYPLHVFENYGYTIEENQSIFLLQSLGFVKPSLPYFQLSVLLLFLSLTLTVKKTRPIDWFLAVTFSLSGFLAVRNLPLFAIMCFIPFTRSLTLILSHVQTSLRHALTPHQSLLFKIVAAALLLSVLIWQITMVSQLRGVGLETKDPYKNALSFFKDNNLKGPIFNNFDIGSYLIYSLYPKEKVFIDGRPEAYPKDFLQNIYIPMQENATIFKEVSSMYHFNTIIVSHTDQTPWAEAFIKSIVSNSDWVIVYLDDSIIILVKNTEDNNKIITSFGMGTDSLTFSSQSPTTFQSLLRRARFANIIQNTTLEKQAYQNILNKNPRFCPALQNLAILLSNENDATATVYINQYRSSCI